MAIVPDDQDPTIRAAFGIAASAYAGFLIFLAIGLWFGLF